MIIDKFYKACLLSIYIQPYNYKNKIPYNDLFPLKTQERYHFYHILNCILFQGLFSISII